MGLSELKAVIRKINLLHIKPRYLNGVWEFISNPNPLSSYSRSVGGFKADGIVLTLLLKHLFIFINLGVIGR